MIATNATHGDNWKGAYQHDISRADGDISVITGYDEELGCYVGNWVYGFGLIGVRFDPQTTRDLTPEEVIEYSQKGYSINGTNYGKLRVMGYEEQRPMLSQADAAPEMEDPESPSASGPSL
jgi:hypothetical protein